MDIRTLINENQVLLTIECETKEEAVATLARTLEDAGKISSTENFLRDVWGRETLGDTAVGFGIAIPHARSEAVLTPAIAIGRTSGLQWNGRADSVVNLIVLLAVPARNAGSDHMTILSNVARMLVDEQSRLALLEAETPEHVLQVIEDYQAKKGR